MLVRLFGKNFGSLRDEFELSMIAANLKSDEDCNRGTYTFSIQGLGSELKILKLIAIYGQNASGKSTVLRAADSLRWMIESSSQHSRPGRRINIYNPFLLDNDFSSAPTELGCDIVYNDNQLLRYFISFTDSAIIEESLELLSENDKFEPLLFRSGSSEIRGKLIDSSEANSLYVKEMQPSVAVLSKLAQHGPSEGEESVVPFYEAILDCLNWVDYCSVATPSERYDDPDDKRFVRSERYRNWVMDHLITAADLGITDVRAKPVSRDSNETGFTIQKGKLIATRGLFSLDLKFLHAGKNPAELDFAKQSIGTQKLFGISGDWWRMAKKEVTIFADELSASLHPILLDQIVRIINESQSKAQLIFSTHDTGLLEGRSDIPPALRRDQVYFTSKDRDGSSNLYSLAEFKEEARSVHNLRKRYLAGLYGAIPEVSRIKF
jgi:uncharacterized protein